MSKSKKSKPTKIDPITDGIDITTWEVTAKDGGKIQYSCWDFAGQSVYYNTHQV